jgi:hypothetical protein
MINDAGARENAAERGQAGLDKAFEQARPLARKATGDDDCAEALRTYLHAYRHGTSGSRRSDPATLGPSNHRR